MIGGKTGKKGSARMCEILYNMIFRRKSFHLFQDIGDEKLTPGELAEIRGFWETLKPLYPDIKTAIRIVPATETTNQKGQEYCIAFYSERKENYLQNIGYLGQMMDLYLVSQNIATCWYGMGEAKEASADGLPYVIMLGMSKLCNVEKFRQNMFQAKRKAIEEIWKGEIIPGVTEIARFSPSACNSQPWYVERAGNILHIYRLHQSEKIGIMTAERAKFFNRIDMGIYLCILELCLKHEDVDYAVALHTDPGDDSEKTRVATITLRE